MKLTEKSLFNEWCQESADPQQNKTKGNKKQTKPYRTPSQKLVQSGQKTLKQDQNP